MHLASHEASASIFLFHDLLPLVMQYFVRLARLILFLEGKNSVHSRIELAFLSTTQSASKGDFVHGDDTRYLSDLGYGYAPFYIEILPHSRHSL